MAAIPTTPDDNKFLVVFEVFYDPPNNDHDIYAVLIEEDGTKGTDFWISWTAGLDETSPAIAGNEDRLQYFVAWRHPQGVIDNPIKARAISHSGALLGQTAEFSGVAADLPAVASGANGDFLTAWQDSSSRERDQYGYLRHAWGDRAYLPLIMR